LCAPDTCVFGGEPLRFGKVIFEQSQDPSIYKTVISDLHLKPPVIIKPNYNNFILNTPMLLPGQEKELVKRFEEVFA
jgi:hypothetical protein